jgi:hypothetical protein
MAEIVLIVTGSEEEEIISFQPHQAGLDGLYTRQCGTRVSDTRYDNRISWIWQVSCEKVAETSSKPELHHLLDVSVQFAAEVTCLKIEFSKFDKRGGKKRV